MFLALILIQIWVFLAKETFLQVKQAIPSARSICSCSTFCFSIRWKGMAGICDVLQISLFAIKSLHNRIIVNALESKSKEHRESKSNITLPQNACTRTLVICLYVSQMNIYMWNRWYEDIDREQAREWHFTPSKSFGSRSIKAFGLVQFSSYLWFCFYSREVAVAVPVAVGNESADLINPTNLLCNVYSAI